MDLFLEPYLKVLGQGVARLLMLLAFGVPELRGVPDTRTSVLGDINAKEP